MVVAWFATAGVPLAALRAQLVVAVPPPLWLWVLPPAGRGLPVLTPAFRGPAWARYTESELQAVWNSVSKTRTVVMFECPRVEHRRERCGFGHIRPN